MSQSRIERLERLRELYKEKARDYRERGHDNEAESMMVAARRCTKAIQKEQEEERRG